MHDPKRKIKPASTRIRYTKKKIKKEIELYRKYQKDNKDHPSEVYYYEMKIHELAKIREWLDA